MDAEDVRNFEPAMLKSFCSVMINHAKLSLAIEEGTDTVSKVRGIIEQARKYNAILKPDQTIDRLIAKIELIYEPS